MNTSVHFFNFFYKSEKSVGKSSILFISTSLQIEEVEFQKTMFQISSIFSKILLGWAYFSTSNHNNFQSIGNKNIVNTVMIIPITAYLIVFIAGFILSSFHQERINNKPHHKIKIIEKIQAAKTNIEIARRIKSQNVNFSHKIDHVSFNACTVVIIIIID